MLFTCVKWMRKTKKVSIVSEQKGKIVFWTTKEQVIGGQTKLLRFPWKTSMPAASRFDKNHILQLRTISIDENVKLADSSVF